MVYAYVATSEITSLEHELRDHSMELGSLVSEAIFPGTEVLEIPARVGGDLVVQFKVDAPGLVYHQGQSRFQERKGTVTESTV